MYGLNSTSDKIKERIGELEESWRDDLDCITETQRMENMEEGLKDLKDKKKKKDLENSEKA